MKSVLYTYWFILLSFLIFAGCLSGKRPGVMLSPQLDKRVYQITPLPITVGLYIEPALRSYVQEVPLREYEAGSPQFTFPDFIFSFGEPLALKIEEMSKIIFKEVVVIDNLQDKESLNRKALDGILAVTLKNSDIKLYIESSVWRAIGQHNLSVLSSFLDPGLNKVWESEVAVEGKGLDFVTSKVEFEWWVTAGPKFGPAVDDAICKLTYDLAQKITASKEISDYIHKGKQ